MGFGGVSRLKPIKIEAMGIEGSELGTSGVSELLRPASSISFFLDGLAELHIIECTCPLLCIMISCKAFLTLRAVSCG